MGAAPHGKRRKLEAARAETGGGQQHSPAAAVRSGCTAGFGVSSGPPACSGNAGCARAGGEAENRTGSIACVHAGKEAKNRTESIACIRACKEAKNRTAGARSRVQDRSAPLDRAGTRTKAEEAQPCTETDCGSQARQSIQPRRTGALGQKTEALRTEKRQKAHRSDGFPACGLLQYSCRFCSGPLPKTRGLLTTVHLAYPSKHGIMEQRSVIP